MAPSNLHESKYPRTTMAAATTTHSTSGIYTTITVGRSSHAIDLLVPSAACSSFSRSEIASV
jgi:hypothetical protein